MEIIKRLQHLPTSSAGVPVSSPQKVSPGMTNAESDTVTENAAEVPKAAILTAVELTAASEEPPSVTAEVAPLATTPSPSLPAAAEETPSATAEAAPPAVEPVTIAAAPSPTPAVAEPTALPIAHSSTTKQLPWFLDMLNFFHRNLPPSTEQQEPLTAVLFGPMSKGNSVITGADGMSLAFEAAKKSITNTALFMYTNPNASLPRVVDASQLVTGMVLQQQCGDV
ncbi:mucin-7-like [Schistocerca serialis cubense]|uniref:mucin-7-like n=1 Tax=Schistocerca serialis cubense TaxID=2023355 RepID=UPI00214EF0A3|nr:mucin-7-like [Schistocerca serialis cubense]